MEWEFLEHGCDSSAYRCFREFHYSFTQSQSMYYRYFSSCLVILVFVCTNIGDDNQYIRKMRSAFRPSQDASYQLRVDNRKKMRELMIHKPFGYGIGLSKGDRFYPKERMPLSTGFLVSLSMGRNRNHRSSSLLGCSRSPFCMVRMDTDVQDHEQTPARLTYCLALYRCRILSGSLCQRRNAISQLHPHIYGLRPLLRRTIHRQADAAK